MKTNIKTYYKNRASVYEKSMYLKNEVDRIREMKQIGSLLKKLFKQKEIIEVACGTGYWTEVVSRTAKNITATDAVKDVLDIARNKKYSCAVDFKISDASSLSYRDETFNAGVANFWFSHMLRKDIPKFLEEFHRILKSGSPVFLCDNVPDTGDGILTKKDKDTFKIRELDGKKYKVIKNYFSAKMLKEIFSPYAKNSKVNIVIGKWAWWIWYEKK